MKAERGVPTEGAVSSVKLRKELPLTSIYGEF